MAIETKHAEDTAVEERITVCINVVDVDADPKSEMTTVDPKGTKEIADEVFVDAKQNDDDPSDERTPTATEPTGGENEEHEAVSNAPKETAMPSDEDAADAEVETLTVRCTLHARQSCGSIPDSPLRFPHCSLLSPPERRDERVYREPGEGTQHRDDGQPQEASLSPQG